MYFSWRWHFWTVLFKFFFMKKNFMFQSIFWKKTVDFIIYNSGENQKTYRDRTWGTPGMLEEENTSYSWVMKVVNGSHRFFSAITLIFPSRLATRSFCCPICSSILSNLLKTFSNPCCVSFFRLLISSRIWKLLSVIIVYVAPTIAQQVAPKTESAFKVELVNIVSNKKKI